jgi:Uma2 family endonuclease
MAIVHDWPAMETPPLEPGDRLTAVEFHRRYAAMPHLKKAELLRGVVYMPSPVSLRGHGIPHAQLSMVLATYAAQTSGVHCADNSTVRLGPESEPQPDLLLMIGEAGLDDRGYLTRAPELIAEIASSSVSYDLHVKRDVYREHGVREYLVWRVRDRAVDWFSLREGEYVPVEADGEGILRSEAFPGLRLDPAALLGGDGPRLLAVLQQGLASPEHAAFVTRLAESAADPP